MDSAFGFFLTNTHSTVERSMIVERTAILMFETFAASKKLCDKERRADSNEGSLLPTCAKEDV